MNILSTEGYIGMAVIFAALLISIFNVGRLAKWPLNNHDASQDELKTAFLGYFYIVTFGVGQLVLTLMAGLMSNIFTSEAERDPLTFGMSYSEAQTLFYGSFALVIIGGAACALRVYLTAPKTDATVALVFLMTAFTGIGAFFSLLLLGAVHMEPMGHIESGLLDATPWVFLASIASLVTTTFYRKWFEGAVNESDVDAAELSEMTVRKGLIFGAVPAVLTLYGVIQAFM